MFRVLLYLFLSIAAIPAFAQPPDIQWEITNRFAPFEAHDDPEALFATWKLHNGHESWEGWHARRWVESGHRLTSPYAAALAAGRPTHWDPETRQHRDSVLHFIRAEGAPETTVRVRLWAERAGPCAWTLGGTRLQVADCARGVSARLPLSGAVVTLDLPDGAGVSRFLAPTHRIIVAIGDSYGSGQGNPDLPARWRPGLTLSDGAVAWMTRRGNLARNGAARWLDEPCARSFFSFQSLTALGIASRDPHVFVSFLHHACSGAEIFDGLLSPQKAPGETPGYNRLSQLNAVIRELCLAPTTDYAPTPAPISAWASVTS